MVVFVLSSRLLFSQSSKLSFALSSKLSQIFTLLQALLCSLLQYQANIDERMRKIEGGELLYSPPYFPLNPKPTLGPTFPQKLEKKKIFFFFSWERAGSPRERTRSMGGVP
jgi:hypothetical protein